jgi:exodeoxyribonuclease VII small subunit
VVFYDNDYNDFDNPPSYDDPPSFDDLTNVQGEEAIFAGDEMDLPESEKREQSFEENLAELEQIVRRLESGEASLAEAMALFRRGTVLSTTCNKFLAEAETMINQLVAQGDGTFEEAPFVAPGSEEKGGY